MKLCGSGFNPSVLQRNDRTAGSLNHLVDRNGHEALYFGFF